MSEPNRSVAWWMDEKNLYQKAFSQLDMLRTKRRDRISLARENVLAYGANDALYQLGEVTRDTTVVQFNALANALRTIAAKTTKSRILPMAVTTGGNWEERSRAKQFNRFIGGLFASTKVWDLDWQWVMDSLLSPDGFAVAKVFTQHKDVHVQRVFSTDLLWDEHEARYGLPMTISQVHRLDRSTLKGILKSRLKGKELEKAIKAVDAISYERDDPDYPMVRDSMADMVVAYEFWRRRSAPDAEDGRWLIAVQGADLIKAPWNRDRFPFIKMHFEAPVAGGMRSISPVRQLLPAQREFDSLNEGFQDNHQLVAHPRLMAPRDCGIQPSDLTDQTATLLPYDATAGNQPSPLNWTPVTPDQYAYRQGLASDMLRYPFGITEMSANGQLPEGITAARALQMVEDNENERLGPSWRLRERFYCELAEAMLDEARDIAKENGGYVVLAPEKRSLYRIDINEVDIAKDRYKVQVFPTSLLSKSPAARYDQLSEMRSRGDIDETEFRQLLDMPDLDAENDLETSTTEIIDKNIDAILSKGRALVAEAFDDHALIILRGAKAYNLARLQGPEPGAEGYAEYQSRLRDLAAYIATAQSYSASAQPVVQQQTDAITPPGGIPAPMAPQPVQGTPMQPFAAPMP